MLSLNKRALLILGVSSAMAAAGAVGAAECHQAGSAVAKDADASGYRRDLSLGYARSSFATPRWWTRTAIWSPICRKPPSRFTKTASRRPSRCFKREDVPVSMGLIVDNSGSMRDKRKKVETAALALVKASNPDDEVFVVNFNDDAYLDLPQREGFHQRHQGNEGSPDAHRFARRHRHARCHPHVDRSSERKRASRQEGAGGGDRWQRQRQHDQPGESGEGLAAERRSDLRRRSAERRGAPRRQEGAARTAGLWPRPPAARPSSPRN